MLKLFLSVSIGLNLVFTGVLLFLNERYGLLAKVERVVLREGRVPGMAASYELNRNYQVRREMFRLDRNEAARILMLGDSLTAQGEWNAMLGEPLVANRGIDGDTSAGLLARVGDDADFRGDAVVIWIGTNDVLQGEAAGAVVENIRKAVAELKGRTTKDTNRHEKGEGDLTTDYTDGHGYSAGLRPGSRAVASESDSLPSKLADSSVSESPISSAVGPASSLDPGSSALDSAPEAQALDSGRSSLDSPKIFVLSVAPMARWWEGARVRNGTIREINAALEANAGEEGFVFVDLHPVLADGDGFLRGDVTSDGVHLNARGYEVVLEKLKESGLF
jgi:lysophospholipase L1-like esterase